MTLTVYCASLQKELKATYDRRRNRGGTAISRSTSIARADCKVDSSGIISDTISLGAEFSDITENLIGRIGVERRRCLDA